MKTKWWHVPLGLWLAVILGCVIFLGIVYVSLFAKLVAYRCADIAENYDERGEYENAAKWYGRASTLRRGDWEYHYGEAEAWRELGRWEEALEAYDRTRALEPPLVYLDAVYVGKARALAGLGLWEEAVGVYGEVIKPELAGPFEDLYDTGAAVLESETYEVAIGDPLDFYPTVWDAGKYVEAIAFFEAAAELEPHNGYPYYMAGRAWLALEQYEKAASCFGVAAKLAPDYAPAWERKAWALGLSGRHEAALACADRALALDADDLDAWNTKGKILLFAGEAPAARECFDRALAQAPYPAEALIGEGITYFAEGKYDEARTYFDGLAGAYGPPYHLLYLYLVDRVEGRPGTDRLRPLLHAPPDPWPEKIRHVLVGRISAEDLMAEVEGRRDLGEYPPGRYEPALPAAPKTAPVRVAPPAVTGPAASESLRSIPVISRIVNQRKGGLGSIYEKYLRTEPDLEGRLFVRFTVAASGSVTACSVVSSTMGNAALEREVCDRIVTWRFPPVDEGDVDVVYPFVFFSAGAK